jgi:hypothetical protein
VRRFSYFAPFPLDAVLPRLVTDIDTRLGQALQDVRLARGAAKTYVARARRW